MTPTRRTSDQPYRRSWLRPVRDVLREFRDGWWRYLMLFLILLGYMLSFKYADKPGCRTWQTQVGPIKACIRTVSKR